MWIRTRDMLACYQLAVQSYLGSQANQVARQRCGQLTQLDRAAVGMWLGQVAFDDLPIGVARRDKAEGELLAAYLCGGQLHVQCRAVVRQCVVIREQSEPPLPAQSVGNLIDFGSLRYDRKDRGAGKQWEVAHLNRLLPEHFADRGTGARRRAVNVALKLVLVVCELRLQVRLIQVLDVVGVTVAPCCTAGSARWHPLARPS